MTKRSQIQLLEKKIALLDTELCKAICIDLVNSIDNIPELFIESHNYNIMILKSSYEMQLMTIKSKENIFQKDLETEIAEIKGGK